MDRRYSHTVEEKNSKDIAYYVQDGMCTAGLGVGKKQIWLSELLTRDI